MNKLLSALLLILSCAHAYAQGSGTVPAGSVPIGLGPTSSGWGSVAPGANGNCLQVVGGAFVSQPCPLLGVSSLTAGSNITLTPNPIVGTGTVALSQGGANTFKGSLNGSTTSDIALTACTLTYQITKWVAGTGWQCGINPVLPSRAVAATLNLAAFDTVTTQGYARPGDGGEATFYKHASAIVTYHVVSAGSCSNGVWYGIRLTGGSGSGAYGTFTVAGGVVTNFTLQGPGWNGNRYAVNDVLTASNATGICTVYPTVQVDSIGNGTFLDTSVSSVSVTNAGGGTCTNGSYVGLTPQNTVANGGGFGDRLMTAIDVAAGSISGIGINAPGGGYKVGDVLSLVNASNGSLQIAGCAAARIQVTGITTPRGSFTDAGGAAWQIISNGDINVLAFGAVPDFNWLMPDGDMTDNGPAIRGALEFAAIGAGPADGHGYGGGSVYAPRGGYLVCGGAIQYEYTTFRGAAWGGTMLKQCNSDGATASLIYQGGPNVRVGNFGINTWDMTLYGSAIGTGPVIYSNNNQSGDAVSRVAIYPNATNRTCLKYELGYGGQSMYGIHNVLCSANAGSPAFDLSGNYGFVIDGQTMISSNATVAKAIRFGDGGTGYVGPGVHCEGAVTACVSVNGSGSSPPQVTVVNLIGPATNLIYIETGTPANFTTLINAKANGSTCTVFMQATATCAKTGNQLGSATY